MGAHQLPSVWALHPKQPGQIPDQNPGQRGEWGQTTGARVAISGGQALCGPRSPW